MARVIAANSFDDQTLGSQIGFGSIELTVVPGWRDELDRLCLMFAEAGYRPVLEEMGLDPSTVNGRPVIFSRNVTDGQAEALKSIMPKHPDARVFDLRSPDRVVVGAAVQGNTKSDRRG